MEKIHHPGTKEANKEIKMTREVSFSVNDAPVSLDYFVQGFIEHTVSGMVAALEGTGEIEALDISIEGDEVKINLNNALVPTKTFVNKIIKSTLAGLASSLKGVGEIDKMNITIRR